MKRNLIIVLSYLVGMFAILSCETVLSVDEAVIEAVYYETTTTIALDVNNDWTAYSSADWCIISPSSGDKNVKSIKVTTQGNKSYSDRECQITISSKKKTESILVKQVQNDAIIAETSSLSISDKAQQFSITVNSNINYTVFAESDWIKQLDTKALSSRYLTFYAEANDSMDSRTGTILLRQMDGPFEAYIKVRQSQKDSIILSKSSIEFNWSSAYDSLDVLANVDYSIIVPEFCEWLHIEKGGEGNNSMIYVSADDFIPSPNNSRNQIISDRNATITICFGSLSREIYVSQRFRDYIWISQENASLYTGQTLAIEAMPIFHDGIDQTLYWKSDNESVATVNDGVILANSKGMAIITVSNADNSYSSSCIVNVKEVIDDIRIIACGKHLHQFSGYFEITLHSRIIIPPAVKSIVFNSVWLCQPNGAVVDIKGTHNGYVQFNTFNLYQNSINDRDLDYLSTWFVLYQVEIDGESYNFRQSINAHHWTSSI